MCQGGHDTTSLDCVPCLWGIVRRRLTQQLGSQRAWCMRKGPKLERHLLDAAIITIGLPSAVPRPLLAFDGWERERAGVSGGKDR